MWDKVSKSKEEKEEEERKKKVKPIGMKLKDDEMEFGEDKKP